MINDEWWLIINHYFSLWIHVHHDKSWIVREWFTSLYTTEKKKTRCQWVVAAKPPLMGDYTSQYIGDYPWTGKSLSTNQKDGMTQENWTLLKWKLINSPTKMESTGIWASRTTLPGAGPRFSHAVFMVRMVCTCSKTQMLQIGCCNEWHHDSNLFSGSQCLFRCVLFRWCSRSSMLRSWVKQWNLRNPSTGLSPCALRINSISAWARHALVLPCSFSRSGHWALQALVASVTWWKMARW